QGVRRLVWLLSAQVNPAPDSETTNPSRGLATTLHHGAGVRVPGSSTITYSRPSWLKPPWPLTYSKSGRGVATGGGVGPAEYGTNGSGRTSFCTARRNWRWSGPW